MIKAILLDFNGVIINDEPIQLQAYQQVLAANDIALSEEDYYSCLGMDDRRFIEAAFMRANKELAPETLKRITEEKTARWSEAIADGVPIFDGIENFIKKMALEFSLGIVSMARLEEIEHVLERVGLRKYFVSIVTAADVDNCKPDPECYRTGFQIIDSARTASGHLPMTHAECLVIEDSPQGIIAAKEAGLPALGVTNTVSADDLFHAGADSVADNLDDWMPDSMRLVFA